MRNDNLLLQDIIEAGNKILRYTQDLTYADFADNDLVKDAVVRNFEIIGEASAKLSETTIENYANVEWRKMKGLRNILIHQYFGVNYVFIWNIIETFLPQTLSLLQKPENS